MTWRIGCRHFSEKLRGEVAATGDQIVSYTYGAERDYSKKLGIITPQGAMLTPDGLRESREAHLDATRECNVACKTARTQALQFLLRHSAYRFLDHAWELEDKHLTGEEGP